MKTRALTAAAVAACSLAALAAATPALAATTLYTSEAAYLAAVGASTTYIDFAGSPAVVVSGASFSGAVTFGSCDGGLATCGNQVLHNSEAITDLGGTMAPNFVAAVGGVFTAPVHAFGFHYISGGMGAIELNGSLTVPVDSSANGFVGIVSSDAITGFVGINALFDAQGNRDRYFIDDFRINAPVPEPASAALLALGLLALGGLLKRRR